MITKAKIEFKNLSAFLADMPIVYRGFKLGQLLKSPKNKKQPEPWPPFHMLVDNDFSDCQISSE